TCDIAVIFDGSPVVDRQGMLLQNRRTLVRALATTSIGVGGDALISIDQGKVTTGPVRAGFAMAFGGNTPTFLDALNAHDLLTQKIVLNRGNSEQSLRGITSLAEKHNLTPKDVSSYAIANALSKIKEASDNLLAQINANPIYTLAQLKAQTNIRPERILLVGGPAQALQPHLEELFSLPVIIPADSEVSNAIGACLTRPTESLEFYADTGTKLLRCPKCELAESISRASNLDDIKQRSCTILLDHLAKQNIHDAQVEVVEADLFATLNDYGSSSKDMRVTCQAVPGIVAQLV
ncbi:MAG: hydantoinase/oxoprolinase family protein, partial [Desulfovibrio sp.]|nr:hydantoinase/oxoprolinase family protein [Desulfovibrio sp.]